MEEKLRWTIALTALLVLGVACTLGLGLTAAFGGAGRDAAAEPAKEAVAARRETAETVAITASIAFTTSMACIAAAYAVGKVGAAALGAASERPELLGRSLLFVGLAEGIAIYGLIIAILLWRRLI